MNLPENSMHTLTSRIIGAMCTVYNNFWMHSLGLQVLVLAREAGQLRDQECDVESFRSRAMRVLTLVILPPSGLLLLYFDLFP